MTIAKSLRGDFHHRLLADLTNLPNQMGNFLKPVADYCTRHGLPQITSIVVSQDTGTPGEYYPGPNAVTDQAKSFVYDWLGHIRKTKVSPESFNS
jgi:hypothetical protein